MKTHKRGAQISVRLPLALKAIIRKYVTLSMHINESDFVRDALREKIKRDALELYQRFLLAMEERQDTDEAKKDTSVCESGGPSRLDKT